MPDHVVFGSIGHYRNFSFGRSQFSLSSRYSAYKIVFEKVRIQGATIAFFFGLDVNAAPLLRSTELLAGS